MTVELTHPAIRPGQPAARIAGARLLGFGAAQPDQVVAGHELGERFGRSAEWIRTRTGIRNLRRLRPGSDIVDLAVQAGRSALGQAQLVPAQIDLVLTASCSIDATSSTQIAHRLAPHAGRLAINAACSGFCYALSTADALIRAGSAHNVMVVAAEEMTRLIDPEDLGTSIIFGDGAGAAVVSAASGDGIGIGPVVWGSDGHQSNLIACRPDGLLQMAGREVFRWAVESVPDLALAACQRAGVSIDDIEVFVPHQANLRIIDAVVRSLGLHDTVIANDVIESGNTSAASIPIALARLIERREARSGQLALLIGFGAGLAYAGQVVALP
ncbi:MAG TPA: beta-ketoacyl-ACP synthase 3 [Jatrophihabitantaceae bacterium]|jgi:3-oxoacyl-[acyl-carrier-protein] synthase-3|nr:beta-ketoacyl-ACP synthase 3 [Jatrophihabitantaceae bacterium]